MPKKVPLVSVGVNRNKATVFPPVGQPFEFTDAELKELDALQKASGIKQYRNLVNEAAAEESQPKANGTKSADDL